MYCRHHAAALLMQTKYEQTVLESHRARAVIYDGIAGHHIRKVIDVNGGLFTKQGARGTISFQPYRPGSKRPRLGAKVQDNLQELDVLLQQEKVSLLPTILHYPCLLGTLHPCV